MEIQGLLSAIGTAVQEAHRAIENHAYHQFFEDYFDKVGDTENAYSPKMIEIRLPCIDAQAKSKVLYAPVAVLVQNKNLNLDTVKLNLNIDVEQDEKAGLRVASRRGDPQKDGEDSKHSGVLEITFRCSETPEGLSRVETQLNSML